MLAAVSLNRIKKFFPKVVHSPTIKTAAKIIGDAGGIAVLPHAFSYGKAINIVTLPFLLAFMKKRGVKGLETQTPRHGKAKAAYLALLARAFRMQQTGGTDLHSAQAAEFGKFAQHKQKKSVAGMLRKRLRKPIK